MAYTLRSLLSLLLFFPLSLSAQMGINNPKDVQPTQDLEVYTRNSFLVQQKYRIATADPNAYAFAMSCSNPPTLTALAGILKDPMGDLNYLPNTSYNCTQTVSINTGLQQVTGIEISFDDFDTEKTTDYVTIYNESFGQSFSGTTLPPRLVLTGSSFSIQFITNNNNITGRGFQLRWRALLPETATQPATALGSALQFNTTASSFIAGYGNRASGGSSTAIGTYNWATGPYSTAIGYSNRASGANSTALGSYMITNNQSGAFMIGDSDPLGQGWTNAFNPGGNDIFYARFLNGYYFMTSGDANPGSGFGTVRTGVRIGRGQSSWATISDSTRKERFLPINHADLLHKIGAMKLSTWNYKGQYSIRHYGPMAQDFYAAFGHDGLGQIGCDTLIYSHDFAGVTFAGVQALIRENEALKTRLRAVEEARQQADAKLTAADARISQQANDMAELRLRLELLERLWLREQPKRTARRPQR